MNYRIEVTPAAMQDLEEITVYIEKALSNPTAASAFLDAVTDCYESIALMPLMYEKCRDRRLSELGCRRAVIKHYVMVYRVDDEGKRVLILRFFYGAREYEKLI